MILRTLLAMTLGFTLAAPAMADIYRWTDDDGQVHFGQNPPMGVDAEPVESRSQPAPADSEPSPDTGQTDEEDATPPDGAEEPAQQEDDDAVDPAMAEMCDDIQQNAEIYADESVRRVQREDGEVEILTPEEREERLGEAEAFLDEHC